MLTLYYFKGIMGVVHLPISAMTSTTASLSGDLSLFLLLPPISRPTFPPPTFSFLRRSLLRPTPTLAADIRLSRAPAAFPTKNSRNQLNEEFEDDDDEEDDDEDGEDESEAAEEYEYESVVSEEEEDEDEEVGAQVDRERAELKEEGMRRRVERVVKLVKELGEDFMDFEELAGIYDFPVDKFQVLMLATLCLYSLKIMHAYCLMKFPSENVGPYSLQLQCTYYGVRYCYHSLEKEFACVLPMRLNVGHI